MAEKAQQWEAAHHALSTVRKLTWWRNACSQQAFSSFMQSGTPAHRMVPLTFRMGGPTSINLIYVVPHIYAQRLASFLILYSIKLAILTIAMCIFLKEICTTFGKHWYNLVFSHLQMGKNWSLERHAFKVKLATTLLDIGGLLWSVSKLA